MKVCPACGTEYSDEAAFCSLDRSPLRMTGDQKPAGLVGQLIGERYQVERRLGEGGMGEVYLARHILMGRPCALKVMNQALSRDPDAVSRFNREATNASRISHPNVCAVYDFGLTPDGLVYLAMEYVEGETLSALLEKAGPLPVQRAAALLGQCADGLRAAHELGIVHRDLKPDNIMVVTSRDRETAKLVDFGIAKAAEGESGQRVTKTGFVVGTPEYMSPEQLSGDPLDGRSDQYSLALVFYRSITGRLPFDGTSAQETLVKRLTTPPRPLAASRPEATFPSGLQGIMDRALARSAEERFPSVTAYAEAVNEVARADVTPTRKLDAAGATAAATIPPTRVAVRERRSAGARWLVATGALVAVGGGAWVVLSPRGEAATPAPAPAPLSAAGDSASATPPVTTNPGSRIPDPGPPPPAPGARPTESFGALDSLVPDPEEFDDAAQRPGATRRAERIMNSTLISPLRRAQAAAALGDAALNIRKDRAAALTYYLRADSLRPGIYARVIRQLKDSVPQ